ncbi:interleukin-17F-like [Syngnathus acus]|uniref:interleukin-17F-like n=1 Tax=Syngnathus acus TaxID=161584 RepID=UPI001885B57C|nr:interleukin-17F-like [Syngnathus acus]
MFPTLNGALLTVAMAMSTALMWEGTAVAAVGADRRSEDRSHEAPTETVTLEFNPDVLLSAKTLRALHNRSISPWTYNVSQDAALFPPVSEARCVLRGCLDSSGVEDLRLESRPILHQVLLLRRVKSSGAPPHQMRRYRLERRLVAVGCTCVRDQQRPRL